MKAELASPRVSYVCAVVWLSSVFAVGAIGASALGALAQPVPKVRSEADARRLHDPGPWRRRERTGVSLESAADALLEHDAGPGPARSTLSLPEARRLGLRPHRSSNVSAWPAEPATPERVGRAGFARALGELCPTGTSADALAGVILDSAAQFEVDPFLLAALLHQQSRCNAREADPYGIGLARINPGMYQRGMRAGTYRYGEPNGHEGFVATDLALGRFPFTPAALRAPAPNVYFAAAFLRVLSRQCPAIDRPFDSIPHRHFVSHFVWGDRVRGTLPEDEILIARRRLLHYYAPSTHAPRAAAGAVALSSPLDGAPRLVIGVMGDSRDGGRRIHRGIDFGAALGEPVRAIAEGIVSFAGADLRRRGLVAMNPAAGTRALAAPLGPRGLFVKVLHADGVESLYAHLADYRVSTGARVGRGEVLGRVGRSGVHTSDAHLHFGLFVDGLAVDPLPVLRAYAVHLAPPAVSNAVAARADGADASPLTR